MSGVQEILDDIDSVFSSRYWVNSAYDKYVGDPGRYDPNISLAQKDILDWEQQLTEYAGMVRGWCCELSSYENDLDGRERGLDDQERDLVDKFGSADKISEGLAKVKDMHADVAAKLAELEKSPDKRIVELRGLINEFKKYQSDVEQSSSELRLRSAQLELEEAVLAEKKAQFENQCRNAELDFKNKTAELGRFRDTSNALRHTYEMLMRELDAREAIVSKRELDAGIKKVSVAFATSDDSRVIEL